MITYYDTVCEEEGGEVPGEAGQDEPQGRDQVPRPAHQPRPEPEEKNSFDKLQRVKLDLKINGKQITNYDFRYSGFHKTLPKSGL